MFNFLLKCSLIIIICNTFYVKAADSCNEEDLALSKTSFLISGLKYEDLKKNDNGVMTLCFKSKDNNPSLVFEYFSPKIPDSISLSMIYYSEEEDCCGGGKNRVVHFDSDRDTVLKVHGGMRTLLSTGTEEYLPPIYEKYVSWVIRNEDLLESLCKAEIEKGKKHNSGIDYVCEIMKIAGLRNVDFGFSWSHTSENLKIIAKDYVAPKYNKHH